MNVDTIPNGNRWVQTCVTQFSKGCSWSILVTGAIHAKAMKSNNLQNTPAALVFSLTDVICYNDAMLRVWYWCKYINLLNTFYVPTLFRKLQNETKIWKEHTKMDSHRIYGYFQFISV